MAVKLKMDETGNAVLQDGNPVYVHDDGTETPYDVGTLIGKVRNLTEEKDRFFNKHKTVETELNQIKNAFGEITPEIAKDAIEKLKSVVPNEDVVNLKKQMTEIFEQQKRELAEGYTGKISELEKTIQEKEKNLNNLVVKNHFSQSKYFTGPEPVTLLPVDIAMEYFGKHFKVEGDSIVGYVGDNKIPSKKNIGEVADFEEAIGAIIENYPFKDTILRVRKGGPSAGGNVGGQDVGNAVTISLADSKNPNAYRAAKAQAQKAGKPLRII